MTQKSFEDILRRYEDSLMQIEKRLYVVESIQEAFRAKRGDSKFRIKNDIIWQMASDTYDMLINDLSSFLKSLFNEGGFFNQLNNCLSKFKVRGKSKITIPNGVYSFINFTPTNEELKKIKKQDGIDFRKQYQNEILKTIIKLFPRLGNIKGHTSIDFKVTPEDINDLKLRYSINDDIFEYRDNVSAHRFQNQSKIKKITGPSTQKLRELTSKLEELFNNIRLVVTDSSLVYYNMNSANLKSTADNISDLILFGSINEICQKIGMTEKIGNNDDAQTKNVYFWQFQKEYWEKNKKK